MRQLKHIHKITIPTFTLPPHHTTNCYIIGKNREAVVIDPIYQTGGPIDSFFTTNGIAMIQYAAVSHPHPDHFGGLDPLINRFGGNRTRGVEFASHYPADLYVGRLPNAWYGSAAQSPAFGPGPPGKAAKRRNCDHRDKHRRHTVLP